MEDNVPVVVSLAVAVIVVVPAATGVITPVDKFTVATPVLEDVYTTPLFVAFAGLTVADTESPVLFVRTGVEPVNTIPDISVTAIGADTVISYVNVFPP